MKNIVVIATASRASGALSIYKQFLSHLKKHIGTDKYFIFIHPTMPKELIAGVEYVEIDTTNYLKRIYFDWFGCKKKLQSKGIKPDVIISLQNVMVRGGDRCKSVVYYHQPLPFYKQRWNPFKKDERALFYYKYIYPLFVKLSLNKDTKVIVQIPFIKRGFVKKFNFIEENVYVLFPDVERIDVERIEPYKYQSGTINLIYPATPLLYKKHITIIEALRIIKEKNYAINPIKVYFTFNKGENNFIDSKVEEYELQDMVVYLGVVSHEILLSMYKSCSALLFPSVIETLGLPLLEAASFGKPIIVSDLDYSREVLLGYNGQKYITPNEYELWADAIVDCIKNEKEIYPLKYSDKSSWNDFFELINN